MDFVELCRNMNIVNTLPEYTKPKNVGLMFFSFEPERFFHMRKLMLCSFLKVREVTAYWSIRSAVHCAIS